MDAAYSFDNYVIKTQGLAIAGKYVVHSPQGEPLLWVKHKSSLKELGQQHFVYSDDKRQTEVMTMLPADHPEFVEYFEVVDRSDGSTVGGIGGDWDNFFTDAWGITDAQGQVIATVRESSTTRSLLHSFSKSLISQVITLTVGDQTVAELRQKLVLRGHNLVADFSKDTAGLLDRRLGLAMAIVVAAHQGATDEI